MTNTHRFTFCLIVAALSLFISWASQAPVLQVHFGILDDAVASLAPVR